MSFEKQPRPYFQQDIPGGVEFRHLPGEQKENQYQISDEAIRAILHRFAVLNTPPDARARGLVMPTTQGFESITPHGARLIHELDAAEIERWESHVGIVEETLITPADTLFVFKEGSDLPTDPETRITLKDVASVEVESPQMFLEVTSAQGYAGGKFEMKILVKERGKWVLEKHGVHADKRYGMFSPFSPADIEFLFHTYPPRNMPDYTFTHVGGNLFSFGLPVYAPDTVELPKDEAVRMIFWQIDRLISKQTKILPEKPGTPLLGS